MAAGYELATAWVRLVPTVDGISSQISKALGGSEAQSAVRGSGKTLGSVISGAVGGAVAVAASKAVGSVMGAIDGAIKRVDIMNNFPKIMKNLGYSADDAQASIDKMSKGLEGLPTSLDQMAGTVQQLAPLTGGLDKATNLSLALNNALLAGGKSTDIQANAMEQYTQMLATGNVDMEAWRSMVTAMPGQMDQLSASLLGAGNNSMDLYDALKAGELSFEDFNTAIVDLNKNGTGEFASFEKQAKDATDGIATSQANLGTAITRNLANAFQKAKPAIDGFFTGMTNLVNALGPVTLDIIDAGFAIADWASEHRTLLAVLASVAGAIFLGVKAYQAYKVAVVAAQSAMALYRAVIVGWKTAAAAAAVQQRLMAGATTAQTVAAKAATIAHKLWNATVAAGKVVWALLNGQLATSAALWLANKTRTLAGAAATATAHLTMKAFAAGTKLANSALVVNTRAAIANTAAWVKSTASAAASKAAFVGQRVAMLASAAATKAAAVAQRVFNTVMNANPIMKIVSLVLALGAALYAFFTKTKTGRELWQKFTDFLSTSWTWLVETGKAVWQGLSDFFTGLWEGVKTIFSNAVDWVVDMFMTWHPLGIIISNWEPISQFFVGLWENIKSWFSTALQFIVDLFLKWSVFGLIYSNWTAIKDFFVNLWTAITTWVSTKIQQISAVVLAVVSALREAWVTQWAAVRNAASSVWSAIKNLVSSGIAWVRNVVTSGVNVVRNAWSNSWTAIRNTVSTAWAGVKSTLNTLITFVKTKPKEAFEKAKDGIGNAWGKIRDLAKSPVRFVVETIINNGLIKPINKLLPKKWEISTIKLPKGFSEGGYTGKLATSAVAGVVHGDEHVIRAASRRKFEAAHPGALDYLNRTGSLPGYKKGGLVHPFPGAAVTTEYMGYPGHTGIDLAKPQGSPIYAAGAGKVTHAGWINNGGGNAVWVDHGGGLQTRYNHMLANVAVKVGQQIAKKKIVGYEGSTGNSTGPHLHYEVLTNGKFQNPRPYLTGGGAYPNSENKYDDARSKASGLMKWVMDNLGGAGGGVWGNVGKGLAVGVAENIIDFIKSKIPKGGTDGIVPTLYDRGGVLPTGLSIVQNKTREPEYVFTGSQLAEMGASPSQFNITVEAAPGMDEEQLARRVMRRLEEVM